MDRERTIAAFRLQAGACRHFGSPLYADLLEAALEDFERGGPVWRLIESWDGDPLQGFLPLRLLGAVHERVLAGAAPELARFYPSAGGRPSMPGAWDAFRELVASQRKRLRARLANLPQTNEVRRCAALLGGFLAIAERCGLPLRLREIGASAGLNLQWYRYRYWLGPHRWGDERSPVCIAAEWTGAPPPLEVRPPVESRAGCDLSPLRLEDPKQLRVLESFVWADQPERLAELRAAVRAAREDPPRLERASAAAWLERELAAPGEAVVRVVFHSSVWVYLDPPEQQRIRDLLARLGEAASERTPLAWLRCEDERGLGTIELRLVLWPPGDEALLAEAHPHGRRVRWLAG